MENKVYSKVGRTYKPIGVEVSYLTDGIWLVNSGENFTSFKNLKYYLGEAKIQDISSFSALLNVADELTTYLRNLGDKDSQEFIDCVSHTNITSPVEIINISIHDLVTMFLVKLQQIIENKYVNKERGE